MSRMEDRARNAPSAVGQETIVMSHADRYLDTLDEMVAAARKRHDPTLSIALSIDMVALLVRDARLSRDRAQVALSLETALRECEAVVAAASQDEL